MLPLPQGVAIPTTNLTPAEQAALDRLQWEKGEPVEANMAAMLSQLAHESQVADGELPPGLTPDRPPINPAADGGLVNFDTLPVAKQQELVAAMRAANETRKRLAAAPQIDEQAGSGVNDVLRQLHGSGLPEVELVRRPVPKPAPRTLERTIPPGTAPQPAAGAPTWTTAGWATPAVMRQREEALKRSQAAAPPPLEPAPAPAPAPAPEPVAEPVAAPVEAAPEDDYALAPGTLTDTGAGGLVHCPHCGHDLAQPDDLEVAIEDRRAFVLAFLGAPATRYTKVYELFGGQLQVEFRSLTTTEADAIRIQLRFDADQGDFGRQGAAWAAINTAATYRLAASLVAVEYANGGRSVENPPLDECAPDDDQPTGLHSKVRFLNEQLVTHEVVRSAVSRVMAQFQLELEKMEANSENPSFFEGIGLSR